jgi:alpha/beta superfamily hydrolase
MGGYVAAAASPALQPAGLFLLAPAVGLPGYPVAVLPAAAPLVSIVHGWDDAIVPLANVLAFARSYSASLHVLADDHLLHRSLDQVEQLFADFLGTCLGRLRPAAPPRELVAAL